MRILLVTLANSFALSLSGKVKPIDLLDMSSEYRYDTFSDVQ